MQLAKEMMFHEHQDRSRAVREERAQAWAKKVSHRDAWKEPRTLTWFCGDCHFTVIVATWAWQLEEDARLAEEKAERIRRLKADNEVIRKQVRHGALNRSYSGRAYDVAGRHMLSPYTALACNSLPPGPATSPPGESVRPHYHVRARLLG